MTCSPTTRLCFEIPPDLTKLVSDRLSRDVIETPDRYSVIFKEGRLECNPKYIEQNCYNHFLSMQLINMGYLTVVACYSCHEATTVSRLLLV